VILEGHCKPWRLFLIASCESTGSSGDAAPTGSYATPESSTASLQAYLQNEIGDRVYFDTISFCKYA
jgi:hypothetical protein